MKQVIQTYLKLIGVLLAPVGGGLLGGSLTFAFFSFSAWLSHSSIGESEADFIILIFVLLAAFVGFLIGSYMSWSLYRTL